MNQKLIIALALTVGIAMSGCQSTSRLGDGALVQKRKYTKGFHLNAKMPVDGRPSGETVPMENPERLPPIPVSAEMPIEPAPGPAKSDSRTASPEELALAAKPLPAITPEQNDGRLSVSPTPMRRPTLEAGAQDGDYGPAQKDTRKTNALAVFGMIIGLAGIFFAGIVLGLVGFLLSGLALMAINKNPKQKGRGIAIAGMIIGLLVFAATLIMVVDAPD